MKSSISKLSFTEQQEVLFEFLKGKIGNRLILDYFENGTDKKAGLSRSGSLNSVGFNKQGLYVVVENAQQTNNYQGNTVDIDNFQQGFYESENKLEEIGGSTSLVYCGRFLKLYVI